MSYIDSKNCSEHLMTNEMGLDRAPFEFQKLFFLVPPREVVKYYFADFVKAGDHLVRDHGGC